jgi:hypothetical protein
MELLEVAAWHANWAWSVPLIVLTVVIHVLGLGLVTEWVVHALKGVTDRPYFMSMFAMAMSATVLAATVLHALEAAIWAAAYRFLGALPDNKVAMLYSLSAMTTYGHANVFLEDHWRMMGALEALNGMLLFGLTAAFLFSLIQQAWPVGSRQRHRGSLPAGVAVLALALLAAPRLASAQPVPAPDTYAGDLWSCPRLTGDWGAWRGHGRAHPRRSPRIGVHRTGPGRDSSSPPGPSSPRRAPPRSALPIRVSGERLERSGDRLPYHSIVRPLPCAHRDKRLNLPRLVAIAPPHGGEPVHRAPLLQRRPLARPIARRVRRVRCLAL